MTAMKSPGGKWMARKRTSAAGSILWLVLAGVATTVPAAEPAGPVAEWNFDERSTVDGKGDTVHDSSGHGHTAQLHGPVWVKHGKGFVIALDGFDDYVDCGSSAELGLGGPVTLEAWVQSNRKAHGEAKLLGEEYSTYVMTYYNGEQVYWYISSGGNNIRGRLSLHQWYHVVASFDGQQMRMWVNGQHVATKESDIKGYQAPGRFHIGAQGSPKSPKFKGMVDRVRIYNRPFSDGEALQHFQAEKDEYLDLTWAGRVKVTPYFYRDRQEVVVECDYKGLQPLQGVGRLLVTLASQENPAEILQQIQIDRVSAKAGLAEVTLPWDNLAAGNYVVRATLTDDHGAYPVEEFDFSCPINAPALVGPAEKQVAPLAAAQQLTPFEVQMGAGGGFTVTVDSQSYPFESRISWPYGDFNRLWTGEKPASGNEKQWHVQVHPVPPEDGVSKKDPKNQAASPDPPIRYQVRAGGASYTLDRQVEVFPTHVYVKDRYTNTTDQDLGLLIYNETPLKPGQVKKSLLSGYDRRGRQQEGSTDYCPSAFFTDANTAMAIVPIDDVYVVQASPYVDWKGRAGVGTEKFALAAGASYTLEWSVYPIGSGDYYDFVNHFRTVENRIGRVDGGSGYITYSPVSRRMVVDKNFMAKRNLKVGISPVLSRPVDDPNLPIEGIEFIDFPKERQLLRLQNTALHKQHPGIKLVFHIAHSLFATNTPDRFADSAVIDADGQQARWGDGRYFGPENAAAGWRYWGFYPYRDPETGATNSFHDALLASVDVMMDEMGFDGGQLDGFLAGYTGQWSYDTDVRWDQHSAEINHQTKTIARRVNSVILISLPSMIEYARKIRDKGGVLLGMHTVFMRSIANEKHIIFTDEGTGPQLHLAPNMMPLSFPQLKNEKELYLDMLDKLSWGEMFIPYSEPTFFGGLTHDTLSSKQFPITFEEIRAGMVKGKERIVTMNSGVYGWQGDDRLHQVQKFDGRGAPALHDFVTTVSPPSGRAGSKVKGQAAGVRTELELAEHESAVIEPIPTRLVASSPVNVRVLQCEEESLHLLLHGQGTAAVEFYVGSSWPDWRNPPGYQVTVGTTTQVLAVTEETGLLTVPLNLTGPVEVKIAPAGEDE